MANKCKRGILISKTPYEKRIAIMEDGELAELVVEGVSSNRVLGNIYKGVVQKVLPALKAAFIDIGLEKAGFLHQEDAMDRNELLRREYGDFFGEVKSLINDDEKYKAFDIRLEHYVVSTGFAETIRGSDIAPFVDGIYGCEFIESPALPGFLDSAGVSDCADIHKDSCEISQIASALDNTSKTRYLFEINKGSNKYPETIDVNSSIARESRRVPFENMIYIADGPSDVPAFSILNYNGGSTFAVYPKGDVKAFRQVDALRRDNRVQMFGEADYETASQSWLWLTEKVRAIADSIVERKQAAIRNSAGAPPTHLN